MIYKPEKDPTTMTEEELEEFLASIDPDEVTPKEQKSPVTLPDVYCDDNVYPSFSVVNGHLIISAEYVRYQGRMHWAYDLQSRRIIAFPLQQNTGN
mgnify:CR=1 FL=1